MKKFLSVFLLTGFLLSLSACQGESPKADFALADAQTLLDSAAFSEPLEELDLEIACSLYGLDQSKITEAAVYGSTGATAEELAVLVFTDAETASAAKANFEIRIEAMKDYIPTEVPKLEKAVLEVRGNTLLFVVANDYAPAEELLK